MDNLVAEVPAGQVFPTNYWLGMVGYLGHDNKLFDRTCPACKGMYSSYEMAACPKCGQPLTYITTEKSTPMAISEGTIYPSFPDTEKQRYLKSVGNRKGGMEAVYRFKVFSFADEKGVLAPPQNHHLMKSGAKVKIQIINHEFILDGFMSKENPPKAKAEVMLMIFPQYGDTVEVQAAPKVNPAVTVDAAGNPVPMNLASLEAEMVALEAKMIALKQAAAPAPVVNTPAPIVDAPAPLITDALTSLQVDPFGKAT